MDLLFNIAQLNPSVFVLKLGRFLNCPNNLKLGDFVWHDHPDTDETFIVLEGQLHIDFRDGEVQLEAGEMYVVPAGVEHKPYAQHEVKILLIEPRGVVNTGDAGGELTADSDGWF